MLKGNFSNSGTFHASYTSKLGRQEVQIQPIQQDSKNLLNNSLITSFEINSKSEIIGLEWINKLNNINGKSSKRRLSNGSNKQNSTINELAYLVVILKNGDISLYSPFQNEYVNEFKARSGIIFSKSTDQNSVWLLYSNEIIEVELNDFKIKNKLKLPKVCKNVKSLDIIESNLVIGGESLVIFNIETKDFQEIKDKSPRSSINSIINIGDHIIVSRLNSTKINIYSIKSSKFVRSVLTSNDVKTLFPINAATFGSITANESIEIFKKFTNGETKIASNFVSFNSSNISVLSAIPNSTNLLVSWFDYEPRFELVNLKSNKDVIEIDVTKYDKSVSNGNGTTAKQIVNIPKQLEVSKEYIVRESEIISLIESKLDDSFELLKVLISNPEKIKYSVQNLSSESSLKIFKILAARIETNSTESSILSDWLKFILLSNNTSISASNPIILKTLKKSLAKSVKSLPTLLSLQGRLELLRSQLQLRNQISENKDIEQDGELHLDDYKVKSAEKSIVYVNGENDDSDDEAIGSAGNSANEAVSDEEVEEEEEDELDDEVVSEENGDNIEAIEEDSDDE